MDRRAGIAGLMVAVGLSAAPASAGTAAVKKGTRGVLEVEYTVTGKGARKIGPTDQSEWRSLKTIAFKVNFVAGDLQAKPVYLAGAPVGAQSYAGQTAAAQQKHQGSMKRFEAEIAKCKKDQDCEARVQMEFMTSAEGAAIVGDIARVSREAMEGGPRYQQWSAVDAAGKLIGATGTYKVDEYAKLVTYDPICGKTNNFCTTVTATKGEGSLVFPSVFTDELKHGGVAVDDKLGLLTLVLPTPYGFRVDAKEDVQSSQTGPSSRKVSVPILEAHNKALAEKTGVADLKVTLPLREERGEAIVPLGKAAGGPMITLRWRFAVVP